MISRIQTEVFKYFTDFLESYGIPLQMTYDPDLDLVTEFRRAIRSRTLNNVPPNWIEDIYGKWNKKYTTNIGLFSRSPITRDETYGNNDVLTVAGTNNIITLDSPEGSLELHDFFMGKVTYNVKLLFDSYDMSDAVELLYACHFNEKDKSLKIDFDLGNGIVIEDNGYTLHFSAVNDVSAVNTSNLRQMDFTIDVNGPFFIPFYKDGEPLLKEIIVNLHMFKKDTSPRPEHATPSATNIDPNEVKRYHSVKTVLDFIKDRDEVESTEDDNIFLHNRVKDMYFEH